MRIVVVQYVMPFTRAMKIIRFFNRKAHRDHPYSFEVTELSALEFKRLRVMTSYRSGRIVFDPEESDVTNLCLFTAFIDKNQEAL